MQPTPQQAVIRGHVTVSVPCLIITALVAAFAHWYLEWTWPWAFSLGAVATWPVWAFLVPRWRDWVEDSGLKGKDVQNLAVNTGLIWPTGFPLSRTEFPRRNGTVGWSPDVEGTRASPPRITSAAHASGDLELFIGTNAEYYLAQFSEADPDGGPQKLGWNWAAFFLNGFWLLYRRMFGYFWAAMGIMTLAAILSGLVVVLAGLTPTPWVNRLLNFAMACFLGGFGNWLYYRHAHKKLAAIHETGAERSAAIARAGGISWLWPITCVVLMLGVLVLIAMGTMADPAPVRS